MADDRPDLVPLADAAELLEISTEAVRKRIQRGTLPGQKIAGMWFVEAGYLPSPASGRPDADAAVRTEAAGRRDDRVQTSGPPADGGRPAAPPPTVDTEPLARLIAELTRENRELAAAAAVWQERARLLGERLQALEAGGADPDAGGAPEPQQQDAPVGASAVPRAAEAAHEGQRPSRPWWRFWER